MIATVLDCDKASYVSKKARRYYLVRPERSAERVVEGRWHNCLITPFDFAQDERVFGEGMKFV